MKHCEWQSDEALAAVEPRLDAIENRARMYEEPLLAALAEEYADKISQRGWLVCGPAGILLMRLLSEDLGVPIDPHADPREPKEALNLNMYIYNLRHAPDRHPSMDHVVVRYLSGHGFALSFDLVYGLLWRNDQPQPGTMRIDRHYAEYIDNDMRDFYALHDLDAAGMRGEQHVRWPRIQHDIPASYPISKQTLAAMHSQAVFGDSLTLSGGHTLQIADYWSGRLMRVLHAVRSDIPALPPEQRPPEVDLTYTLPPYVAGSSFSGA